MSASPHPPSLSPAALRVLRFGVAILIGVHAFSRIYRGTVPDLGEFLASEGLPFGPALAWAVTLTEVGVTLCLVSGRWVRYAVLGDSCILLAGILMVHAREGWFVVGGGRNGVEFSLSLLMALAAIWLSTPQPSPSRPSKLRSRAE